MKELSIFIDESGDFGEYDYHSPWYIVTMVFHEQEASIQEPMEYLNRELSLLGLENHCLLTGPIIRKEEDYSEMDYIEKTDKIDKLGSKRGAALYKFNSKAYRKDPKFKL